MDKIVIIGCGAAGISAAENIRKNNRDIDIIMISDEEYLPYYRLKLSKYLNTEMIPENLYIHKNQWYIDNNIKLLLSKKAVRISTSENRVYLNDGNAIEYSALILANGSHCFIPPISGANNKGIFTIKDIKDVISIQKYMMENNSSNIAVIGGGLLGIEAAYAYRENGGEYNISIIESFPRLLPRQLDEEGSEIIENHIRAKGINIYKSAKIKDIIGENKSEFVELEDGTRIPADIVIISAGVRSNLSMLEGSGITCNKGIIVDKNMRTNINNIFAAGDSAEYNGMVWGIWPVSVEQGKVAGVNSIGHNEEYKEVVPSNLLQIAGLNVFSTGDISNSKAAFIYDNSIYTKLFIENGIIKGAILIGDTKKGFSIKKAIEEKREFSTEAIESDNILNFI